MPNRPSSRAIATSFTSGLAIRKLIVTPSGIPEATKPMKAGHGAAGAERGDHAERCRKDVADALPVLPPSRARVRSMLMKERSTVTMKMIPASSSTILTVSRKKNCTPLPSRDVRSSPNTPPINQFQNGSFTR